MGLLEERRDPLAHQLVIELMRTLAMLRAGCGRPSGSWGVTTGRNTVYFTPC